MATDYFSKQAGSKVNKAKCDECGKILGIDDYICSLDPCGNHKAERPRRVNMCVRCYEQRSYNSGFKKKRKRPPRKENSHELEDKVFDENAAIDDYYNSCNNE